MQYGESTMAKECLKMYFMRTPPTNQFLCRAYLCQAQLMAPASAENPVCEKLNFICNALFSYDNFI